MSISSKPILMWTADDVRALVASSASVPGHLVFRLALPVDDDAGSAEFCEDLRAMANGPGGVIVYGVGGSTPSDVMGQQPFSVVGVNTAAVAKTVVRMAALARSGITPALFGVEFREIAVDTMTVLALSVPRCLSHTHVVTASGQHQFRLCASCCAALNDVDELHASALRRQTWEHQFERFRSERIHKLLGGRGPVPNIGTNLIIMHLVPLGPKQSVDIDRPELQAALQPPGGMGSWSTPYNLDGRLGFAGDRSYVQLFRNGSFEAATSWGINDDSKGNPIIAAEAVTPIVGRDGFALVKLAQQLEVRPPYAFALTILGAKGRRLHPGGNAWPSDYMTRPAILDEVLALPEVVFHTVVDHAEYQAKVQPILDILWQAFGYPRCQHYNAAGQIDPKWLAR